MYLTKKESRKLLQEASDSMLSDFKCKTTFVIDLLDQDDWSFVIKAHAMLEAAVTEMVVEHLGESRLKTFVERLPLSDGQTGKIVVAKNLELLNDQQRKFIRWFSELRNVLVHKVENIDFTFEKHVLAMDSNQKKSWLESIVCIYDEEEIRKNWIKVAEKLPMVVIGMGLIQVLGECSIRSQQCKSKRKVDEASEKTTKELLEQIGFSKSK